MSVDMVSAATLIRLAEIRMEKDEPGYWTKSWERYISQVKAGRHDGQCERPFKPHICHCDKRAREATGLKQWPGGELIFQYPLCPHCEYEVNGDGDSYQCDRCHVSFSTDGRFSMFTDDMGDAFDGLDRAAILAEVTK